MLCAHRAPKSHRRRLQRRHQRSLFVRTLLFSSPLLLLFASDLPYSFASSPPPKIATGSNILATVDPATATNEQIDEFLSNTNYDIQIPISDGQSALVDKQTGRVYWQTGGPAINPHVLFGKSSLISELRHIKAILFSTLLWTCLLAMFVTQPLWGYLQNAITLPQAAIQHDNKLLLLLKTLLSALVSIFMFLIKPRFFSLACNPYFAAFAYVLYLLESYTSSTRRYLENIVSQQNVEDLMETLRSAKPCVTWSLRCYHLETESPAAALLRASAEDNDDVGNKGNATRSFTFSNFLNRKSKRKVVTHRATKQFEFSSWSDHSVVGLWKRAISVMSPPSKAPFTKISFSKMLVLADEKIREDYFSQQANFISREGRKDEQAEYSTDIEVEGFKTKVLVARNSSSWAVKTFNIYFFWCVTLLGLTVPYRIWFSRHCDDVRVTLIKEISTNTTTTFQPTFSLSQWGSFRWTATGSSTQSDQIEARREQFRSTMRKLNLYPGDQKSKEGIKDGDNNHTVAEYNSSKVKSNSDGEISELNFHPDDQSSKQIDTFVPADNQTAQDFNSSDPDSGACTNETAADRKSEEDKAADNAAP